MENAFLSVSYGEIPVNGPAGRRGSDCGTGWGTDWWRGRPIFRINAKFAMTGAIARDMRNLMARVVL